MGGGGGGSAEEPVVNVEKVEVTPPVATAEQTPIGTAPYRSTPVYTPPTSTSDYANPIPQYEPAQATNFGGLTLSDLQDYSNYIKSLKVPEVPQSNGLADLYEAYYRATGRRLGE